MKTTLIKNQLEKLLNEPINRILHREQFTFDEQSAPNEKSLVLFGAGGLGRKTLAGLRRLGIEPLAFADKDPSLWGKVINGIKVFSLEKAVEKFGQSAVFVITIWRANLQIEWLSVANS